MDGTLVIGEYHPAADSAFAYVKDKLLAMTDMEKMMLLESFASTGLSGNRTAELCSETLRRIMCGEAVSDRYLLGLAWTMRQMDDIEDQWKND